jgi:hypothetical protein
MPHGLIIALDIASNTGIAEGFPGSVPKLHSQKFILDDDVSVTIGYGRAVGWFARRLQIVEPVAVFAEEAVPAFAFGGRTNHDATMIRLGLYGALTGVARAKGIPVVPASIARVRTVILGRSHGFKGDEAKREVFRACQARGWTPANKDESDAAAVWLWGCSEVERGILNAGLPL